MNFKIQFTNETYDRLKKIPRYWLPAIGALYFGLSVIWGLPYGKEIEGTIALLITFMNTVLAVSEEKEGE